ncbi:TRAM domain-containing protein, partial [Pseudomonadota bacterium]
AFAYSDVEGATANKLSDQVDEDDKQERLERFMHLQADISAEKLQKKIGQTVDVLVDYSDEEHTVARSKADAPEIDGNVIIEGNTGLKPGDFAKVTITASDEHDLWGSVV